MMKKCGCGYMEGMSCCPPRPMMPSKKCVKTVNCTYRIYRMCYYCVYAVCPSCGHEFDVYRHKGHCPKCHQMHHYGYEHMMHEGMMHEGMMHGGMMPEHHDMMED